MYIPFSLHLYIYIYIYIQICSVKYRILFHRHAPVSADLVAETNWTLNFAHVLVLYSFWRVLFCLPHFRSMRYCLVIPSDFRFKVRSNLASNLVKLLIGEIVWPHTTDVMKMKTIKNTHSQQVISQMISAAPAMCDFIPGEIIMALRVISIIRRTWARLMQGDELHWGPVIMFRRGKPWILVG